MEVHIPKEWAEIILSWEEAANSEGQGLPDTGIVAWIHATYPELRG
jgi:hypothetical protein